jgi:hypothetical protein
MRYKIEAWNAGETLERLTGWVESDTALDAASDFLLAQDTSKGHEWLAPICVVDIDYNMNAFLPEMVTLHSDYRVGLRHGDFNLPDQDMSI